MSHPWHHFLPILKLQLWGDFLWSILTVTVSYSRQLAAKLADDRLHYTSTNQQEIHMNKTLVSLALASCLGMGASLAAANNEVEGPIESVNKGDNTFVVQGITLTVNDKTDYEDGLKDFSGLVAGEEVEVNFVYEGGKHIARDIEKH
jgi:hypothetical protein